MGGAQQRAAEPPQIGGVAPGASAHAFAAAASGGSPAAKGSEGAAHLQGDGDTTDWGGDAADTTGGTAFLDAGDCVQGPSADSFKVCLERKGGEAWGFAWHVGAHAAKRLLVAGVDPSSPAGRWGALQSERGLRGIERGDELTSVNGLAEHGTMRLEMSKADGVALVFRRADTAGADSIGALRGVRTNAAKRRLAPIAPPAPPPPAQPLAEAPERGAEPPPVCIKNTFLHVQEAEDTDEPAFARSDPFPISQLGVDFGRRSSPYTPGCLGGVNLPDHLAKMAAAPGGVNLDASGTGSSWSTARSKSSSDSTGDPAALADAAAAMAAVAAVAAVAPAAAGGDERAKERSRCPSVSTEWDFLESPYNPLDPLYPTAEVPSPRSTSSSLSPATATASTSTGGRPAPRQLSAAKGHLIQNAPLPSPARSGTPAARAAELARAAGLDPDAVAEGEPEEQGQEAPAAAAPPAADSPASPASPPARPAAAASTGSFRDSAPVSLTLETLPSAPRAPAMTIKNTFVELVDEDDKEFDFNETCKTMPDMWHPGLLTSPVAGGGACLANSIQNIAAALAAGERPPPMHPASASSAAAAAAQAAAAGAPPPRLDEEDEGPSGEEEGAEPAEGEEGDAPVRRKKPTRRAGRRARHRRCHAAEARRLAEEPVRRGGRPPKKSVLAAQAEGTAKLASSPDTSGLGLGHAAALPLPATPEALVLGLGIDGGASPAMRYGGSASPSSPVPLEGDPQDVLGKRVLVVGLIRQPEFNGEWGRVESYDAGLQRFVVRVLRDSGPPLLAKLRRENLLVPPTLALRFDDERKPEAASPPPASPRPAPAPWLAEPAFVPYSAPPERDVSPPPAAVVADASPPPAQDGPASSVAAPTADAGSAPAPAAYGEVKATVPASVSARDAAAPDPAAAAQPGAAGRESAEKWRPTLRHLWGEADLDSSGTMSSGPKDR